MTLIGSNNEEKIWNYLKSKGLNNYGAASLMGNLRAESALNPHNLQGTGNKKLDMTDDEYVVAVDNGTYTKDQFVNDGFGFGEAQWTYHTRKQALYEYAKSKNKSIGDLAMQLEFLYKELNEDYKSVLNTLKTATSVLQASNAVLLQYEKPANQSESAQNKRAKYGQEYYDKYATFSSSNNTESVGTITGGNKNMKYNENNKPLVCMQTTSKCYKNTRTMEVKGILWHSTGANNPTLKRYVQPSDDAPDREYWLKLLGKNRYNNDWNHIDRSAGMNCWIGKLEDGTVTTVQTMPWNYRPWGCGKGKNGSCNDGFVQFEICEDDMYGEEYFKTAYQEAIEITAYICKMFDLDPHGTTTVNGVKVPVILCHYDSYHLGLGNNHGDIYTWFEKHGKDMNDVRNDVAALMKSDAITSTTPNASVQPETTKTIKKNDVVKIASNATYYSGKIIPDWAKRKNWIVNSVNGDRVVINKSEDGKHKINSPVNMKYLTVVKPAFVDKPASFSPYEVKITVDALNVRDGAGLDCDINGVLKGEGVYTIVEEANGKGATKWLRLKPISGWIASDHTKKI